MNISGIGPQTTNQFSQRAVPTAEQNLRKESETAVSSQGGSTQPTDLSTALIPSVNGTPTSNEAISSRSDQTSIETNRRRFQLLSESQNAPNSSSQALQSFSDVASFEQKDELSNLYGIDIFI